MSIYLSWYVIITNIQIKIAMSKDKLRILIKILAESHIAFDWEILVSIGLVVTQLCCHKININTKEKDIIRSILKFKT